MHVNLICPWYLYCEILRVSLQLLFGWVLAWRTLIWGSNQLVFLSDKRDYSGLILKLLVMCELVSFVNNRCCWKSFSYVKFLSEPSWFLFNCVLCTGFCSVMQSLLYLFIFAFFQFGLKVLYLENLELVKHALSWGYWLCWIAHEHCWSSCLEESQLI